MTDEEETEEGDESESDSEYVQTTVVLPEHPVQAITPESAPPSIFDGKFMPTPSKTPVIRSLGDQFASLHVSGVPPYVQGQQ